MVLSKCFWQWFLVYFHLLGPWCRGLEHTWDKCKLHTAVCQQCELWLHSVQTVHPASALAGFPIQKISNNAGYPGSGVQFWQKDETVWFLFTSHTWQISSYGTDGCTGLVMNRQSWSQALPPTSRITKGRVRLLTKFMSPPPSLSWGCNEMSHIKDAAYVSQWMVVLVPLLTVIQNERKLSEQGMTLAFSYEWDLGNKSKGLL